MPASSNPKAKEAKEESEEEELQRREYERFRAALGAESDPIMSVLRAHLFAESLLERLILASLSRGDKIIENGSYTFAQKLVLVESFDCIKDSIASSLRQLNKLRNQCAHDLSKVIVESDVVRVGSPLGKDFTRMRSTFGHDASKLLNVVVTHICGFLAAICNHLEENNAKASDAEHMT